MDIAVRHFFQNNGLESLKLVLPAQLGNRYDYEDITSKLKMFRRLQNAVAGLKTSFVVVGHQGREALTDDRLAAMITDGGWEMAMAQEHDNGAWEIVEEGQDIADVDD